MRFAITVLTLVFTIDAAAEIDLFHIKRNKNRNEFHYEGLIDNCRWREPAVRGQWHDLEDGPDVREDIAPWEGGAYGHETRRLSDTRVEVVLNAKKDLPVQVDLIDRDGTCEPVATTTINGERARLKFVYVCARARFMMWPKVHFIEVHGLDDADRPVVQRFPQTRWARKLAGPEPLEAGEDPPMNAPRCGYG